MSVTPSQLGFLVTTSRGLDELLKQELTELCPDTELAIARGGVRVNGDLTAAYKVCLWSRLANRVIWILNEGKAANAEELYESARDVDWSMHFAVANTFSVQFNGSSQAINNTQFGALKIKDAIVDHFYDEAQSRPNVDRDFPDMVISGRLHRDKILLGIELSGGSLHQRAYRQDTGLAPLKEHVAAAMLMRSGWVNDMTKPLVDPMCGSGTLAIEAALMAMHRAPGLGRKRWGFSKWLGHRESMWQEIIDDAKASQISPDARLFASDIDRKLVAIAKQNANEAGVFELIEFNVSDATKLTPPQAVKEAGYLVCNPPYGERLGELTELIPLFAGWGEQLKQHWQDWHVSLLSSNRELLRLLKLRGNKEYSLMNGKLECKLVNYVLDANNCQQFGDSCDNDFANRLKKNLKKLKPWLKQQDTNCYRIYDADLPEYNVAIDVYDDCLVVQEYAPPKTIDAEKARRRLQEVLLYLPAVTGVPAKQIMLKVREQKKGKQQYEKINTAGNRKVVWENGAKLYVNLTDYLDTGLFLDHRTTRQKVRQMAKSKDVLNLFSYTGSVSVAAALGGARSVTTVDMSNTYINWARDNFKLNKLSGAYHFVQADCLQWLVGHNGKYDLIFIDPPSFSNSKRMDTTWDVQRDHVMLLTQAKRCLSPGGTIVFSNNRRGFKLDNDAMAALGLTPENISAQTIPQDFARHSNIHQCWLLKS
ncbi:bifunctional 23S rRNA (guanine(2069)-N(7))-methyltransferase RlmK/23S rRNA (guanine(2445)-N(2))-methyltransferase RlmL [Alteromonas lipolytica]|uniref:Ribosomal RNA large subunit methyltransferase K/L n=1 Tax=Alteromonas lipolytica TaxID=1856405 RepID=A0A1E8FGU2_9ALTE|nr:bifunctional 23S rRNA (guanine(2069)-N(7))-methyltransferase RlmK/23S rRNA (guanine(2445)-N(2))-methyltransferase RlmL [Alteromonas lipolytica]OFI35162.1 23S rRNA (guanine(2445)-N(2))/(guanine(2069)-N(7))-methyltransferase [Alteromonas lipolytica]GGF57245.1 ribosomal RNA large subunit methyltransferase K/L [Alteromonas lipolytica]